MCQGHSTSVIVINFGTLLWFVFFFHLKIRWFAGPDLEDLELPKLPFSNVLWVNGLHGAFHSHGDTGIPQKWMAYLMENPSING